MKLWMVNHHAITPDMPGGTRHFDLARQLVLRGHDVTIIASGFHYALLQEMKTYNENGLLREEVDGVKFVWVKTPPYVGNGTNRIKNMIRFTRLFRKWAKAEKALPDAVIGSTVHPFAALAAGKFAKHKNIPFVFEIRDLWPQTMIDMEAWTPGHPASRFFKMIEKKTVKLAKAVIALSPLTAGYLKDNYGFNNTHFIPNGIDLEQFELRGAEPEADLEGLKQLDNVRNKATFIAMFTGAIVRSNNVLLMLDAAKLLAERGHGSIHIAMVGRGQETDSMKAKAKQQGIDNLHFIQPVPKKQVPHLLKRADALLLVQGKVLWGSMNKLFDYLAARKPVVMAVEAEHNAPIKRMAGCVALKNNTPEELVETLIGLEKMSVEERSKMGTAGHELVRTKHNIVQLASDLEDLLESMNA